jgi:hypothetical protein
VYSFAVKISAKDSGYISKGRYYVNILSVYTNSYSRINTDLYLRDIA